MCLIKLTLVNPKWKCYWSVLSPYWLPKIKMLWVPENKSPANLSVSRKSTNSPRWSLLSIEFRLCLLNVWTWSNVGIGSPRFTGIVLGLITRFLMYSSIFSFTVLEKPTVSELSRLLHCCMFAKQKQPNIASQRANEHFIPAFTLDSNWLLQFKYWRLMSCFSWQTSQNVIFLEWSTRTSSIDCLCFLNSFKSITNCQLKWFPKF